MTTYRVTGKRAYREHLPGDEFEADLPRDVEARALARGSVQIVHHSPVTLQPGTVRLANGWPPTTEEE